MNAEESALETLHRSRLPTVQVAEARRGIKSLLDSADSGRVVGIARRDRVSAIVDADMLRHSLATHLPPRARIVSENDGVSVILEGLAIAADGDTLDDALADTVLALREYAEDWVDHLRSAPNHADNWAMVQLVDLSSDGQLLDWLTGAH